MQFPLKTLIVDDRENERELLKIFLNKYSQKFKIEFEADSYSSAVETLIEKRFQLSIIDHNLDNKKVWNDLIDLVGIKNMGIVVLHTAKGRRGDVTRTNKAGNYIFLPKPLGPDHFAKFLVELEKCVTEMPDPVYRNIVRGNDCYIVLNDDDIFYVQAKSRYSQYFTTKQQSPFVIAKTLEEVTEKLNPDVFIRCHDSYTVNTNYIMKMKKTIKVEGN